MLREKTLKRMAREWADLSPTASHNNIAALIREGQLKLALKEIDQIASANDDVPVWLYTLLVRTIVQAKDFEAVMSLLNALHDKKIDLSEETWILLLEHSMHADHFTMADWIWAKHVEPMFVTPTAECCRWMITRATKEGRLQLAEKALFVLKTIEPRNDAIQPDDTVKAAFKAAGRWRSESQVSKSLHAIFANNPEAFFSPKAALERPPLQRFLNPAYQRRKERLETDRQKPNPDAEG